MWTRITEGKGLHNFDPDHAVLSLVPRGTRLRVIYSTSASVSTITSQSRSNNNKNSVCSVSLVWSPSFFGFIIHSTFAGAPQVKVNTWYGWAVLYMLWAAFRISNKINRDRFIRPKSHGKVSQSMNHVFRVFETRPLYRYRRRDRFMVLNFQWHELREGPYEIDDPDFRSIV